MKILVINGPNLNMLGIREKTIYGSKSYADLLQLIDDYEEANNLDIRVFQSNHEGEIIDEILNNFKNIDGIVINPAAYTHTSIAIFDTLSLIDIPVVEVHISDVYNREDFRKVNFIRPACIDSVVNEGINGYISAIKILERHINDNKI